MTLTCFDIVGHGVLLILRLRGIPQVLHALPDAGVERWVSGYFASAPTMNTAPGSDKARYLISATAKWERGEMTHPNCFHHRPSPSCHSYNVGVISKIHHAIPFKFFKFKRSLSPLSSRASSGLKNSLTAELSDTCEFAIPEADRCSSPELTCCCDVVPSSPADLDCLRAVGLRSSSWMFH